MLLAPETESPGMLLAMDTGDTMYFQYNPEEIEEAEEPRWANIPIAGSGNPRLQFTSGAGHTISFTIKCYHTDDAGMTPGDRIKWCRSLAYPDTSAGLPGRPPSRVALALGSDFAGTQCILTSCRVVSSMFDASNVITYCEISLSFLEISVKAISYSEVM